MAREFGEGDWLRAAEVAYLAHQRQALAIMNTKKRVRKVMWNRDWFTLTQAEREPWIAVVKETAAYLRSPL
jgi:hypothetical protein